MCTSLFRFLIPFNLITTLVAFVAAQGHPEVALWFSLTVWGTTLLTGAALNQVGRTLIGKSAGC